VLSNKFKDAIQLGTHRDESGETTRALGYDAEGKSKIIIFGSGELTGVLYDGKSPEHFYGCLIQQFMKLF